VDVSSRTAGIISRQDGGGQKKEKKSHNQMKEERWRTFRGWKKAGAYLNGRGQGGRQGANKEKRNRKKGQSRVAGVMFRKRGLELCQNGGEMPISREKMINFLP